ncbi:LppM family (lipo)protein [Brachybacterium sp.]|uniref:LppM family (lipo)protein n=1 Tax=Brachybacterium sp. TaxID=1891286 RepID=UPI003F8ECD5A
MNSISTRRRLLAVLLLPFLMVLAGCGKLHADFEITDADTVNAVFDIAVDTEFAEGLWDSAETFCSEMYSETLLDEDAPTVEPYEENGQLGCTISGVITSEDFDSDFNVTEEDGELHLVISGDESTSDLASAEDLGFDFRMTFTFPGKIIEANGGEIDGSSVTYSDADALTTGIDIRADAGGFPWIIVIVVVLVLGFLFLLLLAAVAFFVIRARRNKGGGSTPSGMPGGYGSAAMAGAAAPAAAPGQPGQQWGQASPPPAAPQEQQWGQASPPPAPHPPQGEQPWSQPPQGEQPWSQPPQGEQPWSQPPQGEQPWSQPPQDGQPGQGQQPPQPPSR